MPDLHGKTAVVTGSSRGIGRATALKLAAAGCDVVVNYLRKKSDAQEVAAAVRALGRRCLVVKANVARDSEVAALFEAVKSEFGRLDILIANAASGVLMPEMELSTRHFD